jgi:hypothetical protein
MKKVYLLSLIFLFTSCVKSTEIDLNEYKNREQPKITNIIGKFEIYEIDSCEYVVSNIGFSSAVITHKGNCKFCDNRNKQ